MPTTQTISDSKPLTIDEVLADPPRDRRWEIVRGELKTAMPTGKRYARLVPTITTLLNELVRERALGVVYAGEPRFILSRGPDTLRGPDIALVANDRLPADDEGFFEGPPDLAIEVVSPHDPPAEVHDKAKQWLKAGTKLVWVVWPDSRSVTAYRPGHQPRMLSEGDSLDGGEVVPGFTPSLSALFDAG